MKKLPATVEEMSSIRSPGLSASEADPLCHEGQALEFVSRENADALSIPAYLIDLWDMAIAAEFTSGTSRRDRVHWRLLLVYPLIDSIAKMSPSGFRAED